MKRAILIVLTLSWCLPALAQGTRLLRFADIHQQQVVFVYAGDIYRASVEGGGAKRLTSHPGLELFPKFSPNGRSIAFSAEYNGTRQVYVMPSGGGEPKQLTYYNDVGPMPPRGGWDYRILDWTPDGKNVLVRANRLPWGRRMGRHYLVPLDGGMETPLSIPEGGAGMFSANGQTLVYTPIDREFRTWKRHRGGRAQDVWTYNLKDNTSEQLTDHRSTDHQPLWVGKDIYFVSDRDYKLNLYRYLKGAEPEKVTRQDVFDVLWPSAGPAAIVFEAGGYLHRYDPTSGESRQLSITVRGDWPDARPRFKEVRGNIESMDLSPKGKRVVFGARGEIFSVPAENGEIRNLSRSPKEREISVSWSPDGQWIAYLSDASGEYEIYVRAQDGSGKPRQITDNGDIWRFDPVWSPDSSKLAFSDKHQTLSYVVVGTGQIAVADRSTQNDITDFVWSPDSRYLAYVKNNPTSLSDIWIYSLADARVSQLTGSDTNDSNPVFDGKGRYLYFRSTRDYNLSFSDYEFDYLYTDAGRIYAGVLAADGPALFQPKSDEVAAPKGDENGNGNGNGDEEKEKDKDKDKQDDKGKQIVIDIAGFNERVQALMDKGGDYRNLSANKSGVFYLSGSDKDTALQLFDISTEKEETILKGINGYQLSSSGNKVLFRLNGNKYGIAKAAPKQDAKKGHLDLGRLQLRIDPRIEWLQMYTDAWRIQRDWFYDQGMHGQDWQEIHDRYQPLVEHVKHRGDLDYIFGELAGEMQAGHIYVQSGDQPRVKRTAGGLLGAELSAHRSGYFRIDKIFAGENWHENFRAPLAQPGIQVAVGNFILAVNGISTKGVDNFYSLMENSANQVVTLTINDQPNDRDSRKIRVKTIASETSLRYLDWTAERRRRVDELSGGRIGYIHLPNTAQPGNRELTQHLLPQVNKEALIIDDRYNGGGFIPDRMIEKLARRPLNYWKRRGLDPQSTPVFAHAGPKAMLINGYSSSGGDALPYYFRKLGLGPLIGTRTWGGLIGISGNPGLADGGVILVSTFRFLDTDGLWAVENEGVAPDIKVIDRPEQVAAGQDPSLERAVQFLLQELEKTPAQTVTVPPAPTDFRD